MGQRVAPLEKVTQRSIGFRFRHILFFNMFPQFQPDECCRVTVDDQIKKIGKTHPEALEFLSEEGKAEFLIQEKNEKTN